MAKNVAKKTTKKRVKKNVERGQAHIQASFNNTIVAGGEHKPCGVCVAKASLKRRF